MDSLIHSIKELSKRKVKRSAHVWVTRLNEIYSRRSRLTESHLPVIIRHIVNNNLECLTISKDLLQGTLSYLPSLGQLDLQDISAMCYALCSIGEDDAAIKLLSEQFADDKFLKSSLSDQGMLMRVVNLCISRQLVTDYIDRHKGIKDSSLCDVCGRIIDNANNILQSLQFSFNAGAVEYNAIGDILVENIYLHQQLQLESGLFSASNRFVDYGSLDGRIRISHLLDEEHKDILQTQIATSRYSDILSALRFFFYMKLPRVPYAKELFTRLCNTSGSATHLCRKEAMMILESHIINLERELHAVTSGSCDSQRGELHSYLTGIRKTGLLCSGHVSVHRWNYPVKIPQNG